MHRRARRRDASAEGRCGDAEGGRGRPGSRAANRPELALVALHTSVPRLEANLWSGTVRPPSVFGSLWPRERRCRRPVTCTTRMHVCWASSALLAGCPEAAGDSSGRFRFAAPRCDGVLSCAVCRDWAGLAADLGELAGQLVNVSAITDPSETIVLTISPQPSRT